MSHPVERIMPAHREPSEWEPSSGIDSSFRLSVVAAARSKQLVGGSPARIKADPRWRKNTSIALEEVKQGLVHFTPAAGQLKGQVARSGED